MKAVIVVVMTLTFSLLANAEEFYYVCSSHDVLNGSKDFHYEVFLSTEYKNGNIAKLPNDLKSKPTITLLGSKTVAVLGRQRTSNDGFTDYHTFPLSDNLGYTFSSRGPYADHGILRVTDYGKTPYTDSVYSCDRDTDVPAYN